MFASLALPAMDTLLGRVAGKEVEEDFPLRCFLSLHFCWLESAEPTTLTLKVCIRIRHMPSFF